MKNLSNKKTILIVGGTGGIGSALLDLLNKKRWNIAITGQKNSSRLKDLKKKYDLDLTYEWDAANKQEMQKYIKEIVQKYGTIDALVNCVAIVDSKPFTEIERESTIKEFEINVLGTIYPIQEVLPFMEKNKTGGKIVNLSSLRGLKELASVRSITYSMTKASIISLTAALSKQYGPKIQINAIAPGYTLTTMADNWSENTWDNANNKTITKRPANPKEIAEHIKFLLSDKCSYMHGQTVLVDGGYSLFNK